MNLKPLAWWRALALVVLAIAATMGVRVLAGLVRSWSQSSSLVAALASVSRDPMSLALSQAAGFGLSIAVGVSALRAKDQGRSEALGVLTPPAHVLGLALLAGLLLQLPLSELTNWVQELAPLSVEDRLAMQQLLQPASTAAGFGVALAFVFVAPISEELLFRGLLLPGLSERYGTTLGLVLSSVFFGAVHGAWAPAIGATLAGLLLGALRLRTGSTTLCIAVHAGVNALPVVVPPSLVEIAGFNTVTEAIQHIELWLFALSGLGAAGAFALLWRQAGPGAEEVSG